MKYIIEIPVDAQYIMINGMREGYCYTQTRNVDDLEELNSDYINEHFGNLQDEAYQRGLEDTWEAAKKLYLNGACKDLFGEYFNTFIKNHTAQEAIEKLKAYDDKQKDCIEVGDEVTHKSDSVVWKAVCIRIDGDRQHMNLMGYTGAVGYYPVDDFTKTGKHYDIQSILEAMRK